MHKLRRVWWCALITVMIWVVADASVWMPATIEVTIEPVGPDRMHVEPAAIAGKKYNVEVVGRQADIAQLNLQSPALRLLVSSDLESGRHQLDLLEELRNQWDLPPQVVIREVDPNTMDVLVDWETTVTMPVHVVKSGAIKYKNDEVIVEPTQVKVTLWERDYLQLAEEDRRVLLMLDDHFRNEERGRELTVFLPLIPPSVDNYVTLGPASVKVRVTLAEELEETTFPSVPIKIESSIDLFNDYNVESRNAILNQPVTLRGRPEVIARIRASETRIWGVIALTAEHKVNPGRFRDLVPRFHLPAGVELTSEPEPIELRLVPRSEAQG